MRTDIPAHPQRSILHRHRRRRDGLEIGAFLPICGPVLTIRFGLRGVLFYRTGDVHLAQERVQVETEQGRMDGRFA